MAGFQVKNQIEIQITTHSIVISRVHPFAPIYRAEVDFAREADTWKQQLSSLANELAETIPAVTLRGAKATILYQSPTIACHMSTLPVANRQQAERAARLACAVATHHGDHATVDDAILLGCERDETGVRSHLVATADRLDIIEAIADFAALLGLEVVQILPIEALVTANTVTAALQAKGAAVGCLYIGRTYSCLTVSAHGKLLFFRQIGFSTQQLVEALTLPIAVDPESGRTVDLDQTSAEELICTFGIPDPDAEIIPQCGLRGFHILSALQSHFQRAAVEIKQSLRFGLPEDVRRSLVLTLVGSGEQIPHLDTTLASILEVEFVENAEAPVISICSHAPLDEEREKTRGGVRKSRAGNSKARCGINLIPLSVRQGHFRKRFYRGLWVGFAASLLLLIGDSRFLEQAVQDSTAMVSQMEAERQAQADAFARRDEIIILNAGMSQIESKICEFGEDATDWSAVLLELARMAEDDIRLSSIAAERTIDGRTIQQQIRLEGYTAGGEDQGQIRHFVDALRASPLFSNVTMGDVVPGTIFGELRRSFKLEIAVQPFRVANQSTPPAVKLSAVDDSVKEK